MPEVLTKPCPRCNHSGSAGFIHIVMGISMYYHGTCRWWEQTRTGVRYTSLQDAWKAERERHADGLWRRAWDARIAGNERKAKKLFREWKAST